MTTASDLREIYRYNWRVLRDFCDALSKLPPEALVKDREARHHSMKNIFHHILSGRDGWLNVTAQGASADSAIRGKDFDQVQSMAELRGYMARIIAKEEGVLRKP